MGIALLKVTFTILAIRPTALFLGSIRKAKDVNSYGWFSFISELS
jgi:hypothetical protein